MSYCTGILRANILESKRPVTFISPNDSSQLSLTATIFNPSLKVFFNVLAEASLGAVKDAEITIYLNFKDKDISPGVYILSITDGSLTLVSQVLILFGEDGKTFISYEELAIIFAALDDQGNVAVDDEGNIITS